jgi:hypothetical protein
MFYMLRNERFNIYIYTVIIMDAYEKIIVMIVWRNLINALYINNEFLLNNYEI